jgi:hypothetical protein
MAGDHWFKDVMLQTQTPETFDKWAANEIPFLHTQRTAGLTGRSAACRATGERQQWAVASQTCSRLTNLPAI